MAVFIDLTEFVSAPHRTGIQRVGGELCRCWPGDDLVPVFLKDGCLTQLPEGALTAIRDYFVAPPHETDSIRFRIAAMAQMAGPAVPLDETGVRIIVPEVFYDPARIRYFRAMPPEQFAKFFFVVFDLLPLTHPQFFGPDVPHELIGGYYQLIRKAAHTSFISRVTRDEFYRRLLRQPAVAPGPVLRLGSDSLGDPFGAVRPRRPEPAFAVLGTIEPRKQHTLIFDAFEALRPEIPGITLTFVGRLGWIDGRAADRFRDAAREGGYFRWLENADDRTSRDCLLRTRATIFLSAAEGFGLPPVESLHLGVPVIASSGVPSLEDVRSGVRFLEGLDAESLRRAVRELCDAPTYSRLYAEIARLTLPTWRSFSSEVREWVTA